MKSKTSYLLQVLWHKWFILVAGYRIGRLPLWRLIIHDWTKFLPIEYCVYRKRFTGKPYLKEEWEKAKWHHYLSNPHHYQYWIKDGSPSLMPDIFIREMVIDWMAASRGYQGHWDIQDWLDENYTKVAMHPISLEKLKAILESQGFTWPD